MIRGGIIRYLMSIVVLLSILFFGVVGFTLSFGLCACLAKNMKEDDSPKKLKIEFLLNSTAIIFILTYIASCFFDKNISESQFLMFLSDIQLIKLPETKAFISVVSDGEVFPEFYHWLNSRGILFSELFSYQGSLFFSFLVLIAVYSFALPVAFKAKNPVKLNTLKLGLPGIIISFLCSMIIIGLDSIYLSSRRVELLIPIVLPLISIVLSMYCASIIGAYLSKNKSGVGNV